MQDPIQLVEDGLAGRRPECGDADRAGIDTVVDRLDRLGRDQLVVDHLVVDSTAVDSALTVDMIEVGPGTLGVRAEVGITEDVNDLDGTSTGGIVGPIGRDSD